MTPVLDQAAPGRRLLALLIVALVLAAAGLTLVLAPETASTASTTETTRGTTPSTGRGPAAQDDGRYRGTTGVAANRRSFFRVTSNTGCTECSTVWRRAPAGPWRRLHVFGREAYGRRVDESFGPLTDVAVDPTGRHLFVTGRSTWWSHDGGRTWTRVVHGPGPRASRVVLTRTRVFAGEAFPGFGLWTAPVSGGRWTRLRPGGGTPVFAMAGRVGIQRYGERLSDPRVEITADGRDVVGLPLPCPGETAPTAAGRAIWVACSARRTTTVWRSTDLRSWDRLATVPGRQGVVHALAADRAVLLGRPDRLLVPGRRPVRVAVPSFYDLAVVGHQVLANGYRSDHVSEDGGRTWRRE